MNDQLDKNILIPKKRIPWVKYFFQFTLPVFLGILRMNAQGSRTFKICFISNKSEYQPVKKDRNAGVINHFPIEEPSVIKGIVIDENGKPVPYVSLSLKIDGSGTHADSSGVFVVTIPGSLKVAIYEVSSVGFESKELKIVKEEINKENIISVQLMSKQDMLPVVVTSGAIMGRLRRTTGLVSTITTRKVIEEKKPVESVNPAPLIYPNPVLSGTSVNIVCKKMEEGYYSFKLLSITGQLISEQQVWVDKGAGVLNMPVKSVAAGTYLLNIVNRETGNQFTEKLIISERL